MRSIRRGNFICVLASLIVLALPISAMAQSVIWSSPWTVRAAPWVLPNSFVATGSPAFVSTAMAADGDVLIGGVSFNQDFRIDRVSSNGDIRWSAYAPNDFDYWSGVGAMLPTADGGAFVTMGDPQYTSNTLLVRIGPDGSILWLSEESAWSLAMPTQQTVVTAGYGAVTEFDAITGAVLWQYVNNNVLPASVATDGAGNVFAEVGNGTGVDAIGLDSIGQIHWQVTVDNTTTADDKAVAVSSGLVFLNTSSGVLVLHSDDGSTAWNATQAMVVAMAGSPAEPIVVGNGSIQRLAAADGHAVWTQTFSGSVSFASFTDGEILVGSGNTLTALDPDTGAVLWPATIPAQDGNGHSLQLLTAGTDGGSNIDAVASAGYGEPLFLQPIDSQTGQLQTSPAITAMTTEGVYAADSVEEDSGHIASVALDLNAGTPEIRVRRLDSSTGATLWESVQALDGLSTPAFPAIASGSGMIVAVVAENRGSESSSSSHGFTWVGAFDGQTGNLRWQRILQDPGTQYLGQQYTHASAPIVDPAGDTYVAYGTNISCATNQDPNCTNAQQTLVKLAAADGSTLWRFDNASPGPQYQVFPQDFTLSGDDVVVNGPFSGALYSHDAIDLSGSDGSLRWTSDAFGGGGQGWFLSAPDGSLIGISANNWVKADAASGAVAWTNSRIAPLPCKTGCNIYDQVVAPNGDYFAAGEADLMPFVDFLPAVQGGIEKQWRLDSAYTGLRSFVTRIASDTAGNIWLKLHRHFRHGAAGIDFLAQLDPSSGTVLSQQALAGFSEFPFAEQSIPSFLSAPENNRLEAFTYASGPPTSSTSGVALLDTTMHTTGDLSIRVMADHAVAHPDDTIGFHVVATYSGNGPITGAHIIADPSGLGLPTGLACASQSAANCAVSSPLGIVNASFDIQPGGQVDISGQITVSKAPGQLILPALVYGPIGLGEHDTLNNFYALSLADEIFADGF